MFNTILQESNALPKILIVADGYIDFRPFDAEKNQFSIATFTKVLKEAFGSGNVTTAHRNKEDKGADVREFKFADKTLTGFDQVWLFAHARPFNPGGTELQQSEVDAIAKFMNSGGGVFATGDHEHIGIFMCGKIPRVRSMRKWREGETPSQGGPDRHDTLRIGEDDRYHHDNQGDAIPQELFPRLVDVGGHTTVHPILRRGAKIVIRWLPDHTHEGECVVPENPAADEYPTVTTGRRPLPQVLADTIVIGDHETVEDEAKPYPRTTFKAFGAICAYDGHGVNVGRVVTEATWHHFMDINIKTLMTIERYSETLKAYYTNIALWLSRARQQRALVDAAFRVALRRYPLGESDLSGEPSDVEKALSLGGMARACLGELEPHVTATLLENARPDTPLRIESNPFFDADRIVDAAVGGALLGFVGASRADIASDPVDAAIRGSEAALNAFPAALGQFANALLGRTS